VGKDQQDLIDDERRSGPVTGTTIEEAAIALADQSVDTGPSPKAFVYGVALMALIVLVMFRELGFVARLPVWIYVAVIAGTSITSLLVEPLGGAPIGSFRLHLRLNAHLLAVTVVIYMTGWGPALGMAFVFVALGELGQWGSGLWRPLMFWSILDIAVAQYLIWFGVIPSFLDRREAEAIGALGAIVLAIIIRMAGAMDEKKERAEALLAHQALHDKLTGLPNRAYFYERTSEALGLAAADGTACAVMLFDLDRFKEINDAMGHTYGDRVLSEVGPRVKTVLRADEMVARLGGDEFCVLLPRVDGHEDALRVAKRIIAVLGEPFEVDGISLGIEASCGISISPYDGTNAGLLLQRADVAMYAAKDSRTDAVVYHEELDVNTPAHLALLGDLHHAIARNELVMHYQPKAKVGSRSVYGVEALIRWQHPTFGLLLPDEFIPEAEHTGLIEPITAWVLDESLRQCRQWLDDVGTSGSTAKSVAVNLSARSLLDSSLPDEVQDALTKWNLPPGLLVLEITETMIMTDPHRARLVLNELAGMGIILSIDDFGTGYSSLAYLRDLPVHELKIDRSFVHDMVHNPHNAAIVHLVVDLAHSLGLRTIAEGVEDESTWEALDAVGCDSAQGYHLARPMPADELSTWMSERTLPSADMQLPRPRAECGAAEDVVAIAGLPQEVAAAGSPATASGPGR
jgi:diguanylate cyclase (GGDEF)-like protein